MNVKRTHASALLHCWFCWSDQLQFKKHLYLKKNECPTQVGYAIFSQSKAHILYRWDQKIEQVGCAHFVGSMPTCVDRFHPFFITDEHFVQVGISNHTVCIGRMHTFCRQDTILFIRCTLFVGQMYICQRQDSDLIVRSDAHILFFGCTLLKFRCTNFVLLMHTFVVRMHKFCTSYAHFCSSDAHILFFG